MPLMCKDVRLRSGDNKESSHAKLQSVSIRLIFCRTVGDSPWGKGSMQVHSQIQSLVSCDSLHIKVTGGNCPKINGSRTCRALVNGGRLHADNPSGSEAARRG